MTEKKPYEGKAEMFNVPTLRELMHEMMNIPVFDPDLKAIKSALHRLLEQEEDNNA